MWSRVAIVAMIILFLATNITCAALAQNDKSVIIPRVVISGILFVTAGISLSVCLWKVYHMTSANVLLEARVSSVFISHKAKKKTGLSHIPMHICEFTFAA